MVAAVQLKRSVTGAGIFRIVIGEFSHRKESCPVVLLEVDKGSEVSFYGAVLPLGLTICLRVEGGGKLAFDAKEVAKQRPEL